MVDFENLLINEIQSFPILWDKSHKNYKDAKQKELVWEKLGRNIGQPGL